MGKPRYRVPDPGRVPTDAQHGQLRRRRSEANRQPVIPSARPGSALLSLAQRVFEAHAGDTGQSESLSTASSAAGGATVGACPPGPRARCQPERHKIDPERDCPQPGVPLTPKIHGFALPRRRVPTIVRCGIPGPSQRESPNRIKGFTCSPNGLRARVATLRVECERHRREMNVLLEAYFVVRVVPLRRMAGTDPSSPRIGLSGALGLPPVLLRSLGGRPMPD